jgi:hypothetical protein
MIAQIPDLAWAVGWPLAWAWLLLPLVSRGLLSREYQRTAWVMNAAIATGVEAALRDWLGAAGAAVALLAAIFWWWYRRKPRRSPKTLGEKGRALIAAMLRTLRERARPRTVLRPVPGGARA